MSAVYIIIPTYNALPLLKKHIPGVVAAMRKGDELIVVDDASTDGSAQWLKDEKITVLVNKKNLRFGESCNRGVSEAKSDIVVLLNNDASPEKDFLNILLPHCEDGDVFAVGCKDVSGGQEFGRAEAHFERGFYVHNRAASQSSGETAWVAGGSGAFRVSMWKELKGFDPRLKPAYGEDIDLCYRAHMHGWKNLFEARSIVHHIHESTNASVFGQHQIEIMSYKNAILFMWKNAKGMELVRHFLWLPYHFVFTTIRSQGRFLQGFWEALRTCL